MLVSTYKLQIVTKFQGAKKDDLWFKGAKPPGDQCRTMNELIPRGLL